VSSDSSHSEPRTQDSRDLESNYTGYEVTRMPDVSSIEIKVVSANDVPLGPSTSVPTRGERMAIEGAEVDCTLSRSLDRTRRAMACRRSARPGSPGSIHGRRAGHCAHRQRVQATFSQVSSDSSHSEPRTQDNAESLPLSKPHSKSSHPKLFLPYFRSMRRAALRAVAKIGFWASVRVSWPVLSR
jgi:hypothetical protein